MNNAAKLCGLFAIVLAAMAGCSKPAPQAPSTTIQQYMEGQINPAGDFLFHSVEDISDKDGIRLKAPHTDAEWKDVRDQLAILHDSPRILTSPDVKAAPPGFKSEHPPIESSPEWIQHAIDTNRDDFNRRALRLQRTADVAIGAVDAKDPRALQRALDGVDKACESCHLHYFYPNDKRAWQAAKEDGGVD